jgi:hypothetical protein
MPLLGCTVFKDKILSGEKTQTIRALRKYPINVGDRLYLYWKLRTKQCKKLHEAICTEIFYIIFPKSPNDPLLRCGGECLIFDSNSGMSVNITIMSPIEESDLAHRDGFSSSTKFRQFFYEQHNISEAPKISIFQVIRWRIACSVCMMS